MTDRTVPALGAIIALCLAAMPLAAQTIVTDDEGNEEEIFEIGVFHPAYGAQLTFDYCSACHSEMIIAQQGQTREGWDDILVWMVEDMGMQEIVEEDRDIILDYLGEHYNPDRPHNPLN